MLLIDQFTVGLQLFLAALLGGILGYDRERTGHAAGLRTHMLVCVGACLYTALSIHAFPGDADASRVASQILPGIGFLGAGVILRQEERVKNLTTAATIWATAAIGMGVGSGAWLLAIMATIIVWVILAIMIRFNLQPSGKKPNKDNTEVS